MKPEPLEPGDRVYLREVLTTASARRWIATVIAMRPPIGGKTGEERAMSASEAMGYERAIANLSATLEESPPVPEIKSINIRED